MPLEAKPLFRPDVLRTRLDNFLMPPIDDAMRQKLDGWAELIATNRIDRQGEEQLFPDFLTDFFVSLLGYTGPAAARVAPAGVALASEVGQCGAAAVGRHRPESSASGSAARYTLSRERHIAPEGEFADAVLGDFNGENRFIVAVEGKGSRDPLDRPFAGRRMSAVDQAYRYAINLQCDWIIVTSMRQTRLYHKGSNQQTYERFDTEQLADSEAALARFVFLLGANRVVPAAGECHFYNLLTESERVGRELTKQFYVGYADMRQDAFEQLSRDNPAVSRHEVLASTQKALDRVLFVAFAEDRGLLPAESILKAYEHRDPYHPRPIWDNFRGLFGAINRGNAALAIHAYNGGLFADDPVLDSLAVSDEVCRYFRDLGEYDYRPAHEVTGASGGGRLIDVDILGHIFEQSITDLERLRSELDGLTEPLGAEKHKTRRKKEGAFYTPSFITRYIIEQALGGVLDDRFEQLRREHSGDTWRRHSEPPGPPPTSPRTGAPSSSPSPRSGALPPSPHSGALSPSPSTGEGRGEGEAAPIASESTLSRPGASSRRPPSPAIRSALADPRVYQLDTLTKPQRAALVRFWEAWQDELTGIRLLDPACGSGAFLIEAFDQLHAEYERSNDRLQELRGHRTLFDLDKRILENNLYGVDLNEEAVEICRLSLWIKTAERGKALTSLDHPIRVGNSVVSDPAVHPKALNWQAAFPEVFANGGGFDVVVGNPPYIRQELLTQFKNHWAARFPEVFSGTADIYVYFYALGIGLLRPSGRMAFVSSNSFARSAFAEQLRAHLVDEPRFEQFIDLGDTQVFSDAKDVYPAIVVLSKPAARANEPHSVRSIRLRRSDDVSRLQDLVKEKGWDVPIDQLSPEGWRFDEPRIVALQDKLRALGTTLAARMEDRFFRGIITGLNDAFVIDTETRDRFVSEWQSCEQVLKPFVGGQEVRRWHVEASGNWLIFFPDGFTSRVSHAATEADGWAWISGQYPPVADHLSRFCDKAKRRLDKGKFWWELRACAYYAAFDAPKIIYPDIAKSNRFHLDRTGLYSSNTTYFLPTDDGFLLGVLNSKAIWFSLTGISVPFGERAGEFRYRMFSQYVGKLPIPAANENDRAAIAELAKRCCALGRERYELETSVQHRLLKTFGEAPSGEPLGTLNQKAEAWWEQSLSALGAALKTSFKLPTNPLHNPRIADQWEPYLAEKRAEVTRLTSSLADAESEINARVFRLFNLTDDEIALLMREVEH